MKLYMTERSGNAYKARLLLAMLNVAYEPVMVDLAGGENRAPAFLALNPRGQVPVIEDDGKVYWDSTAVLVYIARKHDPSGRWLPTDAHGMAEVMQWLALAQNEIRYGLQSAYVMVAYNRAGHLEECRELGRKALQVLDAHLSQHDWLALDRITIADLACYPYAASAPVAGIPLEPYGHVQAWIARIESLRGWFPRGEIAASAVH
ncbi:MAG TPA: glutathione S-transferase family protein [Burkholderiales bacterium]|nr:glutathione S-transferase family protein [Burkholderiales bacterium]